MNGNIKIQFLDGQNWVGVDGIVNWSMAADYFKEGRPVPSYVAPIITTDTWNGFQQDVQHLLHDSYYLEFWVKESEIQKLAQIKSCDTVIITDLTNNVKHVVDMQTSDWFDFQEPEQISPTTNFKVSFIYRINKKTVNKFDALSNLVTIVGSGTYYSKYAKVAFDSPLEEIKVPWDDGNVLIESTLRTGYQVLFYLSDSELETFKNDYYKNSLTIDTVAVEGVQELEVNALGEDNYRVVATFITDITSTDQTPAANVVDILTGSTHYYSHFAKLPYIGELEEIRIPWGEGGDKLLQETNNTGFRILYYLSSVNMELFKNDWNQDVFTIDATAIIRKLPLEITQLESGNYQVIASCITVRDTIDSTAALSNVVTIDFSEGNIFYSKYPKLWIPEIIEDISVEWSDGSNRVLRSTIKAGYTIIMYLNSTNHNNLQSLWNQNTAGDITIDAVAAVEKLPLEITQLASGYYQVIVNYINGIDVSTNDLTPANTHNIDIDSGTFYYTDYPIISSIQDTELSQSNNEDGVNITSKAITRDVKLVKLFMNEADTYALKEGFEKSTDIEVDGVVVLENRIVSVTELSYDLYEVNVECLTVAVVTNPL